MVAVTEEAMEAEMAVVTEEAMVVAMVEEMVVAMEAATAVEMVAATAVETAVEMAVVTEEAMEVVVEMAAVEETVVAALPTASRYLLRAPSLQIPRQYNPAARRRFPGPLPMPQLLLSAALAA